MFVRWKKNLDGEEQPSRREYGVRAVQEKNSCGAIVGSQQPLDCSHSKIHGGRDSSLAKCYLATGRSQSLQRAKWPHGMHDGGRGIREMHIRLVLSVNLKLPAISTSQEARVEAN